MSNKKTTSGSGPARRGGRNQPKENWFERLRKKSYFKFIVIGLIIAVIFAGCQASKASKSSEKDEQSKSLEEDIAKNSGAEDKPTFNPLDGTDTYLLGIQDSLVENCGPAEDGFLWDNDCNKITIGDRNKSSEEVAYIYLRSLSLGNVSASEKYSRNSDVVRTLKEAVDTSKNQGVNADYQDMFTRNLYQYALQSMEVKGIESTQQFNNDSVKYTVNARMNDYAYKDFWKKGESTILEDMYTYDQGESDPTKADNYLYELVEKYWASDKAKKKDVQFTVTLQKFADVNSGWVVTEDKGLDAMAKNTQGRSVIEYIKEKYRDYRTQKQTEQRDAQLGKKD